MKYIIVICSIAILYFIALGGIITSRKTEKSTFFSMDQTNWLRSIAILMIMFSHYYRLIGLDYSDGILSLCFSFGFIGVAVFFILSGYSLMISKLNKPNYLKGFLKKRIIRLYIPFLIVYLLDVIIILIMGKELIWSDFIFMPFLSLPGTVNWYLKVQLGLYIIFYIVAKLVKKDTKIIIVTSCICFLYMIIGLFSGIDVHWYEGVFAFPLGMFVAKYKEAIFNFIYNKFILYFCFSTFVFVMCFVPFFVWGGSVFEILYIYGCVQFIACICCKVSGSPKNKAFTYLGVISLELYLVHTVLQNTIFKAIGIQNQTTVIGLVSFFAFVFFSIIISAIVKKANDRISNMLLKS